TISTRPTTRTACTTRTCGRATHSPATTRLASAPRACRPTPPARTARGCSATTPSDRAPASRRTVPTRSSRCPTTTDRRRPARRHRRGWLRSWSRRARTPPVEARSRIPSTPTRQATARVSAGGAARRASGGGYTWQLQYGLGPQPLDTAWTTFASGSGSAPQTVSGAIDLSAIPQSFWNAPYSIDPATRLSIEQYDVTVRVQVFANGDTNDSWAMGEDRRAFHLHHDPAELPGFPLQLGSSGEAPPTLADIE